MMLIVIIMVILVLELIILREHFHVYQTENDNPMESDENGSDGVNMKGLVLF